MNIQSVQYLYNKIIGVLITWGNITGGGCWSTTGVAEGFSGFSTKEVFELGAPPTWQLLSLADECSGNRESTIVHEIIHAWGFQHEHSRPDRSDYLHVNLENTNDPQQFLLIEGVYHMIHSL